MDKQIIVLVCGYGCQLTPKYQQYLLRVIKYTRENLVAFVICCGGFTQRKTVPTMSEARTMRDFLRLKGLEYVTIFCENNSFTTRENLEQAKSFVNGHSPNQYRLVIFCDAGRALKVKLLAMTIFPEHEIQVETYDLSNGEEVRRQLPATVLEVLSLKLPLLARWQHHQRVKRAERI